MANHPADGAPSPQVFHGLLSTITAEVQRVLGPDAFVAVELAGLNTEHGVRLDVRVIAGHIPNVRERLCSFTGDELAQARDASELAQRRARAVAEQIRDDLPSP